MKVIVIGGTGHIGTFLIPMLVKSGYQTIYITRGKSKPYVDDIAWEKAQNIILDRNSDKDFVKKIMEINPDIIVDLINYNINETKKIVEAIQKSSCCSHYLYCSSIWAHGRSQVLPIGRESLTKEPICDYGKDKYESEKYLLEKYRKENFPVTIISPGQISGPGWDIINPWGGLDYRPFQIIADGETIFLPNFGQETLHHIHGEDVAQLFFKAISNRNQALGEVFNAVSGGSITLYGYAKLLFDYFGKEAKIEFKPWKEFCEYVGNKKETDMGYKHLIRSGFFNHDKEEKLLGFRPKYTNTETILAAVKSYVDRGIIKIKK
jgi:nucleoside-diphosphate-sugar epimerase